MIKFLDGSCKYDVPTETYHFIAKIGWTKISCLISQATVEALAGQPIDPQWPRDLFYDQEETIHDIARRRYEQFGLGLGDKLRVSLFDVHATAEGGQAAAVPAAGQQLSAR